MMGGSLTQEKPMKLAVGFAISALFLWTNNAQADAQSLIINVVVAVEDCTGLSDADCLANIEKAERTAVAKGSKKGPEACKDSAWSGATNISFVNASIAEGSHPSGQKDEKNNPKWNFKVKIDCEIN